MAQNGKWEVSAVTALIILSTTLPCFSPKTRVVKEEVSEVEVEDEIDGDDDDDDV